MTLMLELRPLLSLLATDGWSRAHGLRLVRVVQQIRDHYRASGWLEVLGRAEALAGILEEFIHETPSAQRLGPVLDSASTLADLLEHGQAGLGADRASVAPDDLSGVLDQHASVALTAPDGAIIAVNARFCALSGYRRDELIGRNHRLMKSGRQLPAVAEDLWRTISGGGTWQGELENRRKDGEHYWVQATIAPILDDRGRIARYLSICTDITEQKRRLAGLERHARLLDLQRQALQEFIATQDIAAASLCLLDGLLRLTDSAHGFILEAYTDAGGATCLKPLAISGIAWSAETRHLMESAKAAGMEFRDLEGVFGTILRTGEVSLVDDMAGLAGGKPLPNGHPSLHAFAGVPMSEGGSVRAILGLANRPGGYTPSDVDALKTISGTCASLLDAARRKDAQQSAIKVLGTLCAAVGQTTSFPVTREAEDGILPTEGGKILIAEDHLPNQVLLRMQIEALGHAADIAADGATALAMWKSGQHDLLLTDLNMPGMDGLALARSIRAAEQEQGGHLPIIAITGTEHPEKLDACRAAGMDDVLAKPIELDDLRRRLDHWLPRGRRANTVATDPATPASTSDAVLDEDYILRILGDIGQPQMRHLIDLFAATARAELRSCHNSRRASDLRQVALTMHRLKSSARMVGALHFATLAERLEAAVEKCSPSDVPSRIVELEDAVGDLETAARRLDRAAAPRIARSDQTSVPTAALPRRVLVLDDDVLARWQTNLLLESLGVQEILAIDNGKEALAEIGQAGGKSVDLLITDLSMPEMDGIEFLRGLAERGFRGDLIISSGVDEQLLQTAANLVRAKGLQLRGVVKKPMTREWLARLLINTREKAAQPMPAALPSLSAGDILKGIRDDAFSVYFQPKVDTRTLEVVGVEALARWWRDGVPIRPDLFIETAERHCLIAPLSNLLLARTLRESARLAAAGFPLSVAFNLSPQWLSDLDLPEFIVNLTQASGLPVDRLILEITETSLPADLSTSLDILTRLRLKGFKLSIDDFGTGYASMEQLQRLPVSELKIDRSFVQGAAERPTVRAILAASIEMAHKLQLTTVAEGVETQADLDLVRGLGCDLTQGFLIARPMPIDELLVWLQTRSEASV